MRRASVSQMATLFFSGLLAACSGDRGGEPVASTETRLFSRDGIDNRSDFEDAVVGHELQGENVDVTVAPDGQLVGTFMGSPFVGGWEYRRGLFCISMTQRDVRRAPDRQCFQAAVSGREVILVPQAVG